MATRRDVKRATRQAEEAIAGARPRASGTGAAEAADRAGPIEQPDGAEARLAGDPEGARQAAEVMLAVLEQSGLEAGRTVDLADIFVAHWRTYALQRPERGNAGQAPVHNALLFLWEDAGEGREDGAFHVLSCLLAQGDPYPFTLPTLVQRRSADELATWPVLAQGLPVAATGEAGREPPYLALYVRGELLCWSASPGFPLVDGSPDLRTLITPLWRWPELATDGLEGHDDEVAAATPVRHQARQPRHVSPLHGQNSLSIGSSTLLPYTFRAIRAPDRWTRPGDGRAPYYEEVDEQTAEHERIKVILHPTDGRSPLTPEQEAASYAAVLRLDDDKIRAFAICLGAWFAGTRGGDPALGKVTLTANSILEYQGIKRWKGSYTTGQKEKVADDVWALNQIFIRGPQVVYDSRGRERVVNVRSRLLEVAQEDDLTLFHEEVPRAFRVAPGDWIKPLIDDGTRYVATLLAPVLRYNPQQGVGKIAMRLGLHLALHWRFRAAHSNYEQPWYIRTLLDSTGIPIPSHREQRRRMMEQFDQALDQLQADGVIASWQYARHAEVENPHRVFPEWITRTVVIAPPPQVVEQYAELAQRHRRELAQAKRRKL